MTINLGFAVDKFGQTIASAPMLTNAQHALGPIGAPVVVQGGTMVGPDGTSISTGALVRTTAALSAPPSAGDVAAAAANPGLTLVDPVTTEVARLSPDGSRYLDTGVPVVSYRAFGTVAAPVSSIVCNATQGKFGTPTDIRIPANTLRPGAYIDIEVTTRRVGNAQQEVAYVFFGRQNGTGDVQVAQSTVTVAANPTDVTLRVRINVAANGTVWTSTLRMNGATGLFTQQLESTSTDIDMTQDQFVSFGFTTGTTSTDSFLLLSYEVIARIGSVAAGRFPIQIASPIAVPATFFGLNAQDWPTRTGTSGGAAPTFSFGTYSTFDNNSLHWRTIHTSSGQNYTWTNLDTAVNTANAAGRNFVYVFYGCPTWNASANAGVAGPYSGLGEGSPPTTLAQVTQFLTDLIARYNTGGVRKITHIQLWNEPTFTGTANATNYWWGTAAQFVDLLWTAYAAIKAADPGIVVTTPGSYYVTDANSGMNQWVGVAGTVNSTKHGYDCFDAIAAHPYHARPNSVYSGFGDIMGLSLGGRVPFQVLLTQYGKGAVDYYVTEYGVSSVVDAELTAFLALTAAQRAQFITRLLIVAAMRGVKSFCIFSLGNSSNLCGDLTADTTGVIAGYQAAYTALAGKTITAGGWYPDGTVECVLSNGSVVTV